MIVLEFALPKQLVVTANRRGHWSKHSRAIAQLREQAAWAWSKLRADGEPQHDRLRCVAWLTFPDRRARDGNNWADTAKALIDGAVTGPRTGGKPIPGWRGLLPDDDHKHLVGPDMRITDPDPDLRRRGYALRIRLEFEEVDS